MNISAIPFSVCVLMLITAFGCRCDPCLQSAGSPKADLTETGLSPEIVGLALMWRYELQDDPIRCMGVANEDGKVEYFWYMKYIVENNTGKDRFFAPEFEIITDGSAGVITANKAIPPSVYEAILDRINDPKVRRPSSVVGKFGQGVTNAKDSLAVWRHPAKPFKSMTIFIAGLSGEQSRWTSGRYVTWVDKKAGKNTPDSVILRKLKLVDLTIDDLEKTKGKVVKPGPGNSTITIIDCTERWLIFFEDADWRITITQYKRVAFDTILRRQRHVVYEFGRQASPPDQWKTPKPQVDWVMR